MYLKEIGSEGVDWIYVTRDDSKWWALAYTIMSLWVP
jgi:hypothetical protein